MVKKQKRKAHCFKQEATQLMGPPSTAKTDEVYQLERNMEEKIKKLAGDALKPEQVAQIVDLFNRTMDEMMKAQVDSYRTIHNAVAQEQEEIKKCSKSIVIHNADKLLVTRLLVAFNWRTGPRWPYIRW